MKKSELDLSNLKNSFSTLKECYFDYTQQQDEKMKTYIKDSCVRDLNTRMKPLKK